MIREFGFDKKIDTSLSDFKGNIITGRVKQIYLNNTNDGNLGCIEIEPIQNLNRTTQKAYPFFPNNTSYPLIDEIVLCFNLPSQYIGSQQSNEKLYYINSVNIWNNPHVNFYPDPEATNGNIPTSENKSYEEIFNSAPVQTSKTTNNYSTPGSQGTFIERDNIHPLQPYMGDVIQQGRFGNSIRFGSTNQIDGLSVNNWSDYRGKTNIDNVEGTAQTGDPILIFRNGQPVDKNKLEENAWDPIDEQINYDLSSIYMTSNQKIKIETTNNWVNSISSFSNNKEDEKPTKPSEFAGKPQVIINSDRLIFNARKDDTLISAGKSIHLFSNGNINFDTSKMVLESQDIKLGSYDAKQSVILGDKFLEQFDGVLEAMSKLCIQLQKTQIWPAGVPVTEPGVITTAVALQTISEGVRGQIETFKSQVVKTK